MSSSKKHIGPYIVLLYITGVLQCILALFLIFSLITYKEKLFYIFIGLMIINTIVFLRCINIYLRKE